jgi:anthranilate phosphoribosyltransferase
MIKTFNVSTTAAIVAAGAGAHVAKHGNRGITSACGSADVLAELGVRIDAGPEVVSRCIKETNIGFMFAPMYHPAMKFVQPIRKSLDFRTAFNILGPLANPAGVTAQVMGVAEEALIDRIMEALKILGAKRAMVVHGQGLDEISTLGVTRIRWLRDGEITAIELDPADFGIRSSSIDELTGGDSITNANIIRDILEGRETGARKDIVLLNAAAAIIVAGLADDFDTAIELAEESIGEGKALACLKKLAEISNKG